MNGFERRLDQLESQFGIQPRKDARRCAVCAEWPDVVLRRQRADGGFDYELPDEPIVTLLLSFYPVDPRWDACEMTCDACGREPLVDVTVPEETNEPECPECHGGKPGVSFPLWQHGRPLQPVAEILCTTCSKTLYWWQRKAPINRRSDSVAAREAFRKVVLRSMGDRISLQQAEEDMSEYFERNAS